ncbi:hypothetical protein Plhal304r1_c028g0092711 [Plasmopara halstedii]
MSWKWLVLRCISTQHKLSALIATLYDIDTLLSVVTQSRQDHRLRHQLVLARHDHIMNLWKSVALIS